MVGKVGEASVIRWITKTPFPLSSRCAFAAVYPVLDDPKELRYYMSSDGCDAITQAQFFDVGEDKTFALCKVKMSGWSVVPLEGGGVRVRYAYNADIVGGPRRLFFPLSPSRRALAGRQRAPVRREQESARHRGRGDPRHRGLDQEAPRMIAPPVLSGASCIGLLRKNARVRGRRAGPEGAGLLLGSGEGGPRASLLALVLLAEGAVV